MAWSDYDIDPDAARPIVQRARRRFDDLNGMENTFDSTDNVIDIYDCQSPRLESGVGSEGELPCPNG